MSRIASQQTAQACFSVIAREINADFAILKADQLKMN